MKFNQFDIEDFLQNYWQQKPLLIRNAINNFENPITADELAGLACEPHIESRLITVKDNQWSLNNGPFNDSTFTSLPEKNWTLLVQAVDHWVDNVAELLNCFRFIPNWRIDDIMVSYATKGGSVGPHFDNYDVFLLQGAGTRRWQLGARCNENSKLQDNDSLRLLADFQPEQEFTLSEGDILYIPPLYSHYGISQDNDCMTYSIGFRAPSHSELLADYCDEILSKASENSRYTDPLLTLQTNPGEILPSVIEAIQKQLIKQFSDTSNLTEWFGQYMTQAKYSDHDIESIDAFSQEDITEHLNLKHQLVRDSASRFAFSKLPNKHLLYVNGKSYSCPTDSTKEFAELISNQDIFSADAISTLINNEDSFKLLQNLLNLGSLYFEPQDYN